MEIEQAMVTVPLDDHDDSGAARQDEIVYIIVDDDPEMLTAQHAHEDASVCKGKN